MAEIETNLAVKTLDLGDVSVKLTNGTDVVAVTGNALDVSVKNASIAVTGDFYPATQPVSGTVTANQGTAGASAWPVSSAQLPSTIGQRTEADSVSVVLASDSDPIPVVISQEVPANAVIDYDTAAAVAAGDTDTRTFTVAGTDFVLENISASSTARIRVEVKVAGTTRWVKFNSASEPNVEFDAKDYKVLVAETIEVLIKNLEAAKAADVYSTIVGNYL